MASNRHQALPSMQDQAALETWGYHRRDFALALITFPPQENVRIAQTIFRSFPALPAVGIGQQDTALGRLPPEIWWMILQQLPLARALDFSHVNRQAKQAVASFFSILTVSPSPHSVLNALRAILKTATGRWVTLGQVSSTMKARKCCTILGYSKNGCQAYAGFVYLPTFKRYCFKHLVCIQSECRPSIKQGTPTEGPSKLDSAPDRDEFRPFQLIPGRYNFASRTARIEEEDYVHPILVDERKPRVRAALWAAPHRPPPWLLRCHPSVNTTYRLSTAFPVLNVATGEVERPLCCKGCALDAIDRFHTFGRLNPELWSPFHACTQIYTPETLLEHIAVCQSVEMQKCTRAQATRKMPYWILSGGFRRLKDVHRAYILSPNLTGTRRRRLWIRRRRTRWTRKKGANQGRQSHGNNTLEDY